MYRIGVIQKAERSGIEWELVYGGGTRSSMAVLDELVAHGDRVTITPRTSAG